MASSVTRTEPKQTYFLLNEDKNGEKRPTEGKVEPFKTGRIVSNRIKP